MVKGLMSQLVTQVIVKPFGLFVTWTILVKSIFSIMGYIISHIKMAIGMDTWAYSNRLNVLGMTGATCPTATL